MYLTTLRIVTGISGLGKTFVLSRPRMVISSKRYIERDETIYVDLVGIHKQGPHGKGICPFAADE